VTDGVRMCVCVCVQPGNKKKWMDDYCYGAAHEIYAGAFSKDLVGLSFTDAAESVAFHLLLLSDLQSHQTY